MIDYRDVRILVREGQHNGIVYTLTVYVSNDATKFSLEEVAIDGLPPIKIREGARYNSAEEAFAAGHEKARESISP
jgi:hypothetical protein